MSESQTPDVKGSGPSGLPTLGTRGTDLEGTDYENLNDEDRRRYKARHGLMLVVPEVDLDGDSTGLYTVYSGRSRSEYLVDMIEQSCECPDHEYNNAFCKHLRRVRIMLEETPLPAPRSEVTDYWPWFDRQRAEMADLADTFDGALATTDPVDGFGIGIGHKRRSMRALSDALDALLSATTDTRLDDW